jgi:ubiquinone/menaquinone biosynthesis C-methylase UbiE
VSREEAYDRRWAAYNARSLDLLARWLDERPLGRVLDVGCGTANLLARLAAGAPGSTLAYAGVDPSLEMLAGAARKREGARFPAVLVAAAAGALPLRSGAFDTVVSASTLHLWPDPAAGLREVRRVLRPGGALLVLDWDAGALPMRLLQGWMRLARIPHGRPVGRAALASLVANAGFRISDRVTGSAGGAWRLAGFRAVAR